MWIVKLGGSLAMETQLVSWLQMLATHGAGRVAVVPGGATFANAVRGAQAHWCFDDLAAHNMAVLAMAQTALMLHALEPRLVIASSDAQIRQALHAGRTALWMPLDMLRDAPDTLTTWEVTSDSLALWLAQRLHAERLVVVKSCRIDTRLTLAQQGAAGVLDARFAEWSQGAAFPIDLVQRDEVGRVRDALLGLAVPVTAGAAPMPMAATAESAAAHASDVEPVKAKTGAASSIAHGRRRAGPSGRLRTPRS